MRRLGSAIRSRLTIWRVLLAVVLVGGFLAAVALTQGSDEAPADNAARIVPADAVVYVNLSVRRDSDQWKNGMRIMARFPRLVQERNRLLGSLSPGKASLNLEQDVEPWLGNEAAFALLPDPRQPSTARSLILLEVSNRDLARSFLERVAGKERTTTYRDTAVRLYGTLATAFVGGFLAIGRPDNVRAAIDTTHRQSLSLERLDTFKSTKRAIPDRDRLLYAYATRTGVRRVLASQRGFGGRLARLVDEPGLLGAATAVRAEGDGVRVDLASALEGAAAAKARTQAFTPQLLDVVSEDALAYAGMRGADRLLDAVASFAGGQVLPLGPELRGVRSDLERAGGLRALRRLRPLLDEEAALFVSRSAAVPVVTLVVDQVNGKEADQLLNEIQPLLAGLARRAPVEGRVPTLEPVRVAGVNALTLRIGPALELTYAIFDGRAVISTSPGGIRRVKLSHSRLTDNELFAPGMRDDLRRVSSVLFLDLEQLLALGEQAGLGDTPGYQQLKSELGPVRAVTAIARQLEATKTTEIFIEVP